METLKSHVQQFITEEDGPTAVEYAVVVAMIVMAAMAAITSFEDALSLWLTDTATTLSTMPK